MYGNTGKPVAKQKKTEMASASPWSPNLALTMDNTLLTRSSSSRGPESRASQGISATEQIKSSMRDSIISNNQAIDERCSVIKEVTSQCLDTHRKSVLALHNQRDVVVKHILQAVLEKLLGQLHVLLGLAEQDMLLDTWAPQACGEARETDRLHREGTTTGLLKSICLPRERPVSLSNSV